MNENQFTDLWQKGMQFNKNQRRWCLTRLDTIPYPILGQAKCWQCPQFVFNHGVCDPL